MSVIEPPLNTGRKAAPIANEAVFWQNLLTVFDRLSHLQAGFRGEDGGCYIQVIGRDLHGNPRQKFAGISSWSEQALLNFSSAFTPSNTSRCNVIYLQW